MNINFIQTIAFKSLYLKKLKQKLTFKGCQMKQFASGTMHFITCLSCVSVIMYKFSVLIFKNCARNSDKNYSIKIYTRSKHDEFNIIISIRYFTLFWLLNIFRNIPRKYLFNKIIICCWRIYINICQSYFLWILLL